ncbi:hypothetical protein ABZ725_51670 [Streptomyces sp. NPDC006872]|uniref:hypothetical protein n=1 Tax=Streptomyces sp. NPDC006872 TaxID=3155720 RepID=UPI0033C1F39F
MSALELPVSALLDTATVLVVPGIARWLGISTPQADGPGDALDAYLATSDHTTQGGPA